MSSPMPLYYAGVASDDDELEEMLKKDKKLEHGFSSTLDLQRILGVGYQQIPLSRVKKMTAAVITVVAIILFISLSFHSAATSQKVSKPQAVSHDNPETTASTTSPTGTTFTTKSIKLDTKSESVKTKKGNMARSSSEKTQRNSKISVKSMITSPIKTTSTTKFFTRPKNPTLNDNPHTRNHTRTKPGDKSSHILPTTNHPQTTFVLAMNPSIPANLNLDCSTCAMVANSADLLNSNAGSVIDSNDCVIRLNAAPTSGYEVDVGAKTTVRVVSQHHLGDLLHYVWHAPEEIRHLHYIVTFGRKNALCQNCTFFKMFKKVSEEYLGDKFIRLTKPLEKNINTGRKKARRMNSKNTDYILLSTQFHAINAVRKVCNRMQVFGVEANHPCLSDHSYTKSYWQPNEYVTCDGSREEIVRDIKRYRFEKGIYDKWADQYDLKFLYP